MRTIREWLHRLAGALRAGRRDRELAEELQLYLELAAEDARRHVLASGVDVNAAT